MILPTLLIIDDEKPTRDALRMGLEDHYDIYVAANKSQAQAVLESESIDLVLTDLRLGGESGMDILQIASNLESPPLCMMMTAYGSVDTAVEAIKRGAYDFITKPLNLDEVDLLLKRALRTRTLEKTNRLLEKRINKNSSLDKILGHSEAMEKVLSIVNQIAPTKSTVLIEGESGTGKELVAEAIHKLSGRPTANFVVVNCAALSPQLLESELFGHEKGAFTGAIQRRTGRFEQANGGTLFLDEIGEIDASTQVKLLRVLSERTIERVGSNTTIPIDVRIVAATNKSLEDLVKKGIFREDLYFRLHVVKLQLPPLRDRKEDIMLLANSFIKEFSRENNKPVKPLSDSSIELLEHYSWPGNVRELRTAIEHGTIMSNGNTIEPKHLPAAVQKAVSDHNSLLKTNGKIKQITNITLVHREDLNLESLEQKAIAKALEITKHNKTAAAELLGISRRTLQRKLNNSSSKI